MDDSDWVGIVDGVVEELAAIFREPLIRGNAIIQDDVADWSAFANLCAREAIQNDPPSHTSGGTGAGPPYQDPFVAAAATSFEASAALRFSIPNNDPPVQEELQTENPGVGPSQNERHSIGVGQTPLQLATQSVGVGQTPDIRRSIGIGRTPVASNAHSIGVGQTPLPANTNHSIGVGQSPEFAARWGPTVQTQDIGVGGGSVLTPERPRRFSEKWQVASPAKKNENENEVEGVDPPRSDFPEPSSPSKNAEKKGTGHSETAREPNQSHSGAPSAYFTPDGPSCGASSLGHNGAEMRGLGGEPSSIKVPTSGDRVDSISPKRTCKPAGSPERRNMEMATPRREPISPDEELQGSPMDREELPTKKYCLNERSSISPMRDAHEDPSRWGSKLVFDANDKDASPSRKSIAPPHGEGSTQRDVDDMDTDVILGLSSPKGQAGPSSHLSPLRNFLFPKEKGLQGTSQKLSKEVEPLPKDNDKGMGLSTSDMPGISEKENKNRDDGPDAQETREQNEAFLSNDMDEDGNMELDTSDFAFVQSQAPSAPIPMSPVAFIPPASQALTPGLIRMSKGMGEPEHPFGMQLPNDDNSLKSDQGTSKQGQKTATEMSDFVMEANEGDIGPRQREPSLGDSFPLATSSQAQDVDCNESSRPFSLEKLDASQIKKARPSRIPTPPREKPATSPEKNVAGMKTPKSPRCVPKMMPSSKGKPRQFGYQGNKPQGQKEDRTNTADVVAQFHSFLKQGKKKEESLASGRHDVKVPALQRAAAAKQKQEEKARERAERKKMFKKEKNTSDVNKMKEGGVKRQAEAPATSTIAVKKQKVELPVGPIRKPTGTHQFKPASVKKPGSALKQMPPGQSTLKKEPKSFLSQNQKSSSAFGKSRLGLKGNPKTPPMSRGVPAPVGTPEYELTPPSVVEKNLSEREQRAYRKEKHIPSWARNGMGLMNHLMGKQKRTNPDELFKKGSEEARCTLDLIEVFGKPDLTIPGNIRKEQMWLKRSYSNGDWSDWQG